MLGAVKLSQSELDINGPEVQKNTTEGHNVDV